MPDIENLQVRITAKDETAAGVASAKKSLGTLSNDKSLGQLSTDSKELEKSLRAMQGLQIGSLFSKDSGIKGFGEAAKTVKTEWYEASAAMRAARDAIARGGFNADTLDTYQAAVRKLGEAYTYAFTTQNMFTLGLTDLYKKDISGYASELALMSSSISRNIAIARADKVDKQAIIDNALYSLPAQFSEEEMAQIANVMIPTKTLTKQIMKNIKVSLAMAGSQYSAKPFIESFTRGSGDTEELVKVMGVSEAFKQLRMVSILPSGWKDTMNNWKNLTFFKAESWKNLTVSLQQNRLMWSSTLKTIGSNLEPLKEKFKAIKNIISGFSSAFPVITTAVLSIASAILVWVKSLKTASELAKTLDELGDAADRLGVSYENLKKYSDLGDILGYDQSAYESAMKKLRISMANKPEAISALGIDTTNMNLEQTFDAVIAKLQTVQDETERTKLAFDIFGKSATSLTPLLNANADNLANLTKGFKTLGSVASEKSVFDSDQLQNNIKMMKSAIEGFKNSFQNLIPVLSILVAHLTKIIGYATVLMEFFMGIKPASVNASTGISNFTDSVDNAVESVKELTAGVRRFDELNNLDFETTTDEDSYELDEDYINSTQQLSSITESMQEALNKVEAFRTQVSGWEESFGAIIPWIVAIVSSLIGFLLVLSGHPILAIPFFAAGAMGVVAIASQISGCQNEIEGMSGWDVYFGKLGEQLGMGGIWITIIVGIVSIVAGVLLCINGMFSVGIPLVIAGLGVAGGGIALGFTDGDLNGKSMWAEWFDGLVSDLKNYDWLIMLAGVVQILGGVAACLFGLIPVGVGLVIAGAATLGAGIALGFAPSDADPSKSRWGEFFEGVANFFKTWGPAIAELAGGLAMVIAGIVLCLTGVGAVVGFPLILAGAAMFGVSFTSVVLQDPTMATKEGWGQLWEELKQAFTNIGLLLSEKWSNVTTWWNNGPGKIFHKEYWTEKWTQIKNGFVEGFNNISLKFETWLNGIIDKLNQFSVTLPEALGGTTIGFNLQHVQMPRLATGGIVTAPTIAQVGEAGPEAILPLSGANANWMDVLADKIAERSGNRDVVIEVDGKELARTTLNSINGLTRGSGSLGLRFA